MLKHCLKCFQDQPNEEYPREDDVFLGDTSSSYSTLKKMHLLAYNKHQNKTNSFD